MGEDLVAQTQKMLTDGTSGGDDVRVAELQQQLGKMLDNESKLERKVRRLESELSGSSRTPRAPSAGGSGEDAALEEASEAADQLKAQLAVRMLRRCVLCVVRVCVLGAGRRGPYFSHASTAPVCCRALVAPSRR